MSAASVFAGSLLNAAPFPGLSKEKLSHSRYLPARRAFAGCLLERLLVMRAGSAVFAGCLLGTLGVEHRLGKFDVISVGWSIVAYLLRVARPGED